MSHGIIKSKILLIFLLSFGVWVSKYYQYWKVIAGIFTYLHVFMERNLRQNVYSGTTNVRIIINNTILKSFHLGTANSFTDNENDKIYLLDGCTNIQ